MCSHSHRAAAAAGLKMGARRKKEVHARPTPSQTLRADIDGLFLAEAAPPVGEGEAVAKTSPVKASPSSPAAIITPRTETATAGDPAAARRILALLDEIGAAQMLQEDFHPWFWEHQRGKLMTV